MIFLVKQRHVHTFKFKHLNNGNIHAYFVSSYIINYQHTHID